MNFHVHWWRKVFPPRFGSRESDGYVDCRCGARDVRGADRYGEHADAWITDGTSPPPGWGRVWH